MSVAELIQELGYQDSPNFLQEKDFGDIPGYSHLFRRAISGCRLKGVYTLKDDPGDGGPSVVPLVYVCEESPETSPEEIHRLAWNQNVVPFVLVVANDVVRLYSGFSYATPSEAGLRDTNRPGVLKAAVAFNRIASQLATFKADAIDRGDLWREWESSIDPSGRVDWRLLDNLKKLGDWLRAKGLPKNTAHALIGKYVYLRYLRDRGILSDRKFEEWGLMPQTVFGRHATPAGVQAVNARLEEWLNGSVFPLEFTGAGSPSAEHVSRVAGAFMGDDPETDQLHLDFEAYDFSFIPIETLSVVYEQFLHAEGKGRSSGAYYTPVPLVNFMLQELEDRLPLRPGMRVLDGSCGSGAFLVQCYRRLIERRVRETGKRLRPSELRKLLIDSIFGVDRDEDACRVAELSLVLTLLDYIDPPDLRRNPKFKVPALHNKNIFHCDFFSPNCPILSADHAASYDWVVGNPPWVKVKKREDGDDEDIDRHVRTWIGRHKHSHPTGGNQTAQAFVWLLGRFMKPGGSAALLMPAKTLFNDDSVRFRKAFFSRHRVWCIANFANMAEVLFAGRSRVPAAAFYFSTLDSIGTDPEAITDVLTYSPFVANQEANRPIDPGARRDTWNIVVNAGEVRRVPLAEAVRGELLTWKMAMWGSPRDARLIRAISHRFPTLEKFCKDQKIEISEGFQSRRGPAEGVEFVNELVGKNILDMESLRGCGRIHSIPVSALTPLTHDQSYVRTRGGKRGIVVSRPPHIIVDSTRRFAAYSADFIGIPHGQFGIAGKPEQAGLLKAMSLFLGSAFSIYYQFFTSPSWGVKREQGTLKSLKALPVPFETFSADELARWERLHTKALRQRLGEPTLFDTHTEDQRTPEEIDRELNEMSFAALGLSEQERWLVEDLAQVRIELDEGKLGARAVGPPSISELEVYASALAVELDSFLGHDKNRHEIKVVHDGYSGMVQTRVVTAGRSSHAVTVEKADGPTANAFNRSRDLLRRQYTQWVYFDRRLLILDGEMTFLFKPLQNFYWTPGQALNDADLFIGETVAQKDPPDVDRG